MSVYSILLKVTLALAAMLGVTLNVIDSPDHILARLSYFTNQSNLAVMLFYSYWGAKKCQGINWEYHTSFPPIRMALTVSILLTGLVYHLLLAPAVPDSGSGDITIHALANLLVHSLVPCGVLADYLLFDTKGRFRWYYPVYGCLPPLTYLAYVCVYIMLGGHFIGRLGSTSVPYFFLDITTIGLRGVTVWCLLLLLCLLIGGALLVLLDRLLRLWTNPLKTWGNSDHTETH